jgi:hypothetical protein
MGFFPFMIKSVCDKVGETAWLLASTEMLKGELQSITNNGVVEASISSDLEQLNASSCA